MKTGSRLRGADHSKGAHFGSGRHIYELDFDAITTFLKVRDVLQSIGMRFADRAAFPKVQWAFEFVYSITITTVKLSVLFFYHRMFPNSATNLKFKVGLYSLAAVSVVLGLGTFIACVFECDLTSLYWDRTSYGLCIDMKAFLLSTAILNLFTDIAILILPISVVWKLQIKKSQKVAITGIFLLGGLYVNALPLSQLLDKTDRLFSRSQRLHVEYRPHLLYGKSRYRRSNMYVSFPIASSFTHLVSPSSLSLPLSKPVSTPQGRPSTRTSGPPSSPAPPSSAPASP